MRYQIVWDRVALYHFADILDYLQTRSDDAPRIVRDAILERLDQISCSPLMVEVDRLKTPRDENFRALVVFSYRITYQIHDETNQIRILRLRHTSREPLGY
jgi:plasmid stabilization system protein ParE